MTPNNGTLGGGVLLRSGVSVVESLSGFARRAGSGGNRLALVLAYLPTVGTPNADILE